MLMLTLFKSVNDLFTNIPNKKEWTEGRKPLFKYFHRSISHYWYLKLSAKKIPFHFKYL